MNAAFAERSAKPSCCARCGEGASCAAKPPRMIRAEPLDHALRGTMERGFSHDFANVRVYGGDAVDTAARTIGARAFSLGPHVFLPSDVRSAPDRTLVLAHELAHVVQQSGAVPHVVPSAMTRRGDRLERDAEAAAERVVRGEPARPRERSSPALAGFWGSVAAGAVVGGLVGLFAGGPVGALIGAGIGAAAGGIADWALSGGIQSLFSSDSWHPETNPDGSCRSARVEVKATHVGGGGVAGAIVGSLPIYHTLVVYTDHHGARSYFRGGPHSSECPAVPGNEYGAISVSSGPFVAGTIDFDANASTTAMTGQQACGKDECLGRELNRIAGRCIPYEPTGNNSNTVARTLLSKCDIPQKKPVTIAPGWGNPDL